MPALCADDLGARHYPGTSILCVARIQHNKPGVFDPAIGIFKGPAEHVLQRLPLSSLVDEGLLQAGSSVPHVIIEKQAKPDRQARWLPHPETRRQECRTASWSQTAWRGCREAQAHWPADMWHSLQQDFAFNQRFANKPEQILKMS